MKRSFFHGVAMGSKAVGSNAILISCLICSVAGPLMAQSADPRLVVMLLGTGRRRFQNGT